MTAEQQLDELKARVCRMIDKAAHYKDLYSRATAIDGVSRVILSHTHDGSPSPPIEHDEHVIVRYVGDAHNDYDFATANDIPWHRVAVYEVVDVVG